MKEKIKKAILDMSSKVERDTKHMYTDSFTKEKYQGVSSVSGIVPKDWLAAWGAKEAVKSLGYTDHNDYSVALDVWTSIKNCKTIEDYVKILKEAKGASGRKSKQALIDGKVGHKWLETYVDAKINGKNIPIVPTGLLERPIRQWLKWEENEIDYWIASEGIVVYPEKRYAGQFDAIAQMKTGDLSLIDFKFASNISEDYYLQTAAYVATFEPYGIKFDKRIIVRLPKTLEKEQWIQSEYKYQMVPNDIEVKVVPTSYEGDRDAFFHALPLKGWINYVVKMTEVQKKEEEMFKRMTPFKEYPTEKINPNDIPF